MQFGVVSSKPRENGRRRNRAKSIGSRLLADYIVLSVPRSEAKRVKVALNLVKKKDRFLAQLLIPINLNKLKQEDELHIYDASL